MSEEESLSPASRLNSDSATSPVCAATATAAPTVTSCKTPSCMATRSSTSGPYNSAAASAPTLPAIAPAHVFLGDSTGASLGPPSQVPAAMAHVSQIHVRASGITTSAVEPTGCASLWSPWRIATVKASSADAYSTPNTVTATAASGRRSGPRANVAAVSTTSSHSAPTKLAGPAQCSGEPLAQTVANGITAAAA